MSLGLRLWLLLSIAGCAEQALVVPDSDWKTVPARQRSALDRQYDTDLAAARGELAAASASLAALPRAQPVVPHAARAAQPGAAVAPAADDPWADVIRHRERARIDALHRIDAAAAEVQRTDLLQRQLRRDAASARIDMIVSQREVLRAQAIDHQLPSSEHYDVAPLRGQFSRAQQRWYALMSRARAAHDTFEHASAELASAKEAYAQLMRDGAVRPALQGIASDDPAARLELPAWTISRSDIRRRRGLRHFLDEAIARPQLRRAEVRLTPAGRPVAPPALAATPAPPTNASPGAPAPPGAAASPAREPSRPAPAPPDRPGDRAAALPPASTAPPAGKPAQPARTSPAASAPATSSTAGAARSIESPAGVSHAQAR